MPDSFPAVGLRCVNPLLRQINGGNHWSLAVIVRPHVCMDQERSKTDNPEPDEPTGGDVDLSCILLLDSLGDFHGSAEIAKRLRS